jgi:hypothetical protein
MQNQKVAALAEAFSKSRRSDIDAAWTLAESMEGDLLPLFAEAFPQISKSEGRASVLRYVGKFSRENHLVFRMGLEALQDRAYAVRYYACALLAFSLRKDAIPPLHSLTKHADLRTAADAKAAIDAIKHRNHYYFMDRDHSGRVRWEYGSI